MNSSDENKIQNGDAAAVPPTENTRNDATSAAALFPDASASGATFSDAAAERAVSAGPKNSDSISVYHGPMETSADSSTLAGGALDATDSRDVRSETDLLAAEPAPETAPLSPAHEAPQSDADAFEETPASTSIRIEKIVSARATAPTEPREYSRTVAPNRTMKTAGALSGAALLLGAAALASLTRAPQNIAPEIAVATPPSLNAAPGTAQTFSLFAPTPAPTAPAAGPGQTPAPGAPPLTTTPGFAPPNGIAPAVPLPDAPSGTMPGAIPTDPAQAAFARAVQAQQSGKNADAIAAYEEVLRAQPNAVPAHLNLAILFLSARQPEKAVPHLRDAVRLDPKNPAAAFQLAQVLAQTGKPQEALAPLQAAIQLAPQNPQGYAFQAQLLTALKKPKEAFIAWKKLADLTPQDAGAAFAAGSLALETKNLSDAEKYLTRAAKLEPKDPRGPLQMARVLAARGKNSEAEKTLADAAKRFPKIADMPMMLAELRQARDDKKGALEAVRAAAKIEMPKLAQSRVQTALGKLLAQNGDWKGARSAFAQAVSGDAKNIEARAMLAEASARTGDTQTSVTQLQAALKLNPKADQLRLALARALAQSKQRDDAIREYSRYVKAQPRNPQALSEYAQLLESAKRSEEAISAWRRAAELTPKETVPKLQIARLLRAAGRDGEAKKQLDAALKIAPDEPNALILAAQLDGKRGEYSQAASRWKKLYAQRTDFADGYVPFLAASAKSGGVKDSLDFLRAQLMKKAAPRESYAALLKGAAQNGASDAGRNLVKDVLEKRPQDKAARAALDDFDLKNAKAKLQQLEKEGREKPSAAPTEKPTATATPKPDATPKIGALEKQDFVVETSPTPAATPTSAPKITVLKKRDWVAVISPAATPEAISRKRKAPRATAPPSFNTAKTPAALKENASTRND